MQLADVSLVLLSSLIPAISFNKDAIHEIECPAKQQSLSATKSSKLVVNFRLGLSMKLYE